MSETYDSYGGVGRMHRNKSGI